MHKLIHKPHISMMDQMKELMALQKKAGAIQEKLGNTHIEADKGIWTVTISGQQICISAKENNQERPDLVEAFNKALKKSQEIAAHEMKDVMGDLGIPGLGAGK